MRIIAFIEKQEFTKKILQHLGLWDSKPRPHPGVAKTQPPYTEAHIDYLEPEIPPSDNALSAPR
jgi:hypothetical protein